jgi:hypothetical protein
MHTFIGRTDAFIHEKKLLEYLKTGRKIKIANTTIVIMCGVLRASTSYVPNKHDDSYQANNSAHHCRDDNFTIFACGGGV